MRRCTAVIWPGQSARCDEAIAEAAAAHDVLMQAIGLMCETFALASQGDVSGARTTAEKTVAIASELGEYYDLASSGGVAHRVLGRRRCRRSVGGQRGGKGAHQLGAHDDGDLRRLGGPGRVGARRSTRRPPVGRRGRVDDEGRLFVVGAGDAFPRRNRGWRTATR